MTHGRSVVTTASLAVLAAPLIMGSYGARADELSDLRANQQLLQQRVDQLAQAPAPANPYGVGGPAGPRQVQMMGGSFPRSFLIPGTDTSIRVGGELRTNALYYLSGGNPHGISTNAGQTGQLNNIPLVGAGKYAGQELLLHVAAAEQGQLRDPHADCLGRGAHLPRVRLRGRSGAEPAAACDFRQSRAAVAVCLCHVGRLPRRSGQLELQRLGRQHRGDFLQRPGRRPRPFPLDPGALHDALGAVRLPGCLLRVGGSPRDRDLDRRRRRRIWRLGSPTGRHRTDDRRRHGQSDQNPRAGSNGCLVHPATMGPCGLRRGYPPDIAVQGRFRHQRHRTELYGLGRSIQRRRQAWLVRLGPGFHPVACRRRRSGRPLYLRRAAATP